MKKIIIPLVLAILTASFTYATGPTPDSMYVHFTSSQGADSIVVHAIADVDSIVYYAPAVPVVADAAVGDFAHGGIVFYILQSSDIGHEIDVQHGLVCAVSDQNEGSGIHWYNYSDTITNASGTDISTGAANTDSIVVHQGVGAYAAYLCDTLTLGGYTDWFLPSKDELNAMNISKTAINTTANSDFANAYYWSSSEDNFDHAWIQSFDDSSQYSTSKYVNLRVRAVRAF